MAMKPFPLHCNNCLRMRAMEPLTLNFHVSQNCSHVLCDHCLASTCPLCKVIYQNIAINNELPRPFRHLFTDPMTLLRQCRRVAQFQSEQRASLDNHLFKEQCEGQVDNDRRHAGFLKVQKKLQDQTTAERSRCARYQAYINSRERRGRSTAQSTTSSISSISRPVTPNSMSESKGRKTI